MWYDSTAIVAGLSSLITLALPKAIGILTRHHAETRAATLKEISDKTGVMDRQVIRLEAEVLRLSERNEDLSVYVCELEEALRRRGITPPDPPWSTRRSDQFKRPRGPE